MPSIFGESSVLDEFTKLLQTSKTVDESNGSSRAENESEMVVAQAKCDSSLADDIQTNVSPTSTDSERIKLLEDEIERLKCLLKTTTCLFESCPIADITYFDNELSRKFRVSIDHFINTAFKADDTAKGNLNSANTTGKDENQILARCIYFADYVNKCYGRPSEETQVKGWEIPRYVDSEVRSAMGNEGEEREETSRRRSKMTCFNCGGDHSISNCPDERDQARINANKSNFLNTSAGGGTPKTNSASKRYTEGRRFDDLKPGVLSDKLKEALGMKDNELPPYIYNMRVLGYPPGHLQRAKNPNRVAFRGDGGKEEHQRGEQLEEGELMVEEVEQEYNSEMIIRYPGFNIQAPMHVLDDHLRLNMPAMQPFHDINFMLQHLNSRTTIHQGKRRADEAPELSRSAKKRKQQEEEEEEHQVVDMDLEDQEEDGAISSPPDRQARASLFQPPPPPPPPPLPPLPDSPQSPPPPPSALETPRSAGPPSPIPDSPWSPPPLVPVAVSTPSLTPVRPSSQAASLSPKRGGIPPEAPDCPESPTSPQPSPEATGHFVTAIPYATEDDDDDDVIVCDIDEDYVIQIDDDDDDGDGNADVKEGGRREAQDGATSGDPAERDVKVEPEDDDAVENEEEEEEGEVVDEEEKEEEEEREVEEEEKEVEKEEKEMEKEEMEEMEPFLKGHEDDASPTTSSPGQPADKGTYLVPLEFLVRYNSLPSYDRFSEGVVGCDLPEESPRDPATAGFAELRRALLLRRKK